MLPGFRFFFAAILLSMSILIFGLGAAALLRAAHEEVASIPTRWAPPQPVFAQQNEPPTLALLSVEPPVAEKPAGTVAPVETPAEQIPDATPPVTPEKLAAPNADESVPPEAAKQETPAIETATTPAAPATPDQAEAPASTDETKLAASTDDPRAVSEAAPATPEPASAPVTPEPASAPATPEPASAPSTPEVSPAAMKIATLGGPAVTVEETASAKATNAMSDSRAAKKRLRAQRAKERRRAAQRAVVQQPLDPFALPTITRAKQ
jgi:hypothetical protein